MSELIYRDDGSVVLPTSADPASFGHERIGYRRFNVALDVGGRGDDPSALSIIKSESVPFMTGREWQQALTPPRHTVVWTESVRLDEATDLVDWTVSKLRQLKHWRFAFDATGMGAPLVSMFAQAKVAATPVIMTAGASMRKEGGRVYVSKNLLMENVATAFENKSLMIASDLPERDDLVRELTSFEYQATSAGNLTLQGGGKGHHADRAVATAIALLLETHVGSQRIEVTRLRGMH